MIENLIDNLLQNRRLGGNSKRWANWESALTISTCQHYAEKHGTIVNISVLGREYETDVNAHLRCKCKFIVMRTKTVGTATTAGVNGADFLLFYTGTLPDYYVCKEQARDAGWQNWKGNLNNILPGKMIGGNVFKNLENKLPFAPGRIWYEADINYTRGYRNRQRILYSNDDLVFVIYDHYQTFYEITQYTIDFRGVKHYLEMHLEIKQALDFPDYYGCNWDAFWDCLTDMVGRPVRIEILGIEVIEEKFDSAAEKMLDILRECKHYDHDKFMQDIQIEIIRGERREMLT